MNSLLPSGSRGWRRWTQFSLRTFLLLVTLCAVWLCVWVHRTRAQEEAIHHIEAIGGTVGYDFEWAPDALMSAEIEPNGPRWVRRIIGDDYFRTVVQVELKWPVSPSDLEVLAQFPKLKYLNLGNVMGDGGSLTDEGARSLSNLSALETFAIIEDELTDDGFSEITKLRSLKVLSLPGLEITDEGFASIANLTSLEELGFGADLRTPDYVTHRTALISDSGLVHLSGLTSLTALNLDYTRITDAGLVHLSGLTSLRTLNLDYTQITGEGFRHLRGLTSLEVIGLGYAQVSDDGVETLVQLQSLTKLDLGGTQITDAGVEKLVALKSLKEVHPTNAYLDS